MVHFMDKLFEAAKTIIFIQGGDGCVIIVSKNHYKQLAEKFFEYEKSTEDSWLTLRTDYSDHIVFGEKDWSEEYLIFSESVQQNEIPFYDAVFILGEGCV